MNEWSVWRKQRRLDYAVETELQRMFDFLHPANRKKALHEISQYLLKSNKKRVSQQHNADGASYPPRKNKTSKRKMLLGFKRHMRAKASPDKAEVGIYGHAAKVASIHDQGKTENGIKYPSRNLVRFSTENVPEIDRILQRYVIAQGVFSKSS